MTGWVTRIGFGAAVLAILFYALKPATSAFGQLGRGVDTLTKTQRGGRAMPHVVAFEKAAVALTGQSPDESGGMDTPRPAQPLSLLDRLFSDKPDPTARAQLQDLAAQSSSDDRKIKVKKYVPGGR